MTGSSLADATLRDLYTRMLQARIVDDYARMLHVRGEIDFVTSSWGYEAAHIGSAVCIEVGKDFTLPYYRDLGVVLTIGMTPYEIFRTYLHARHQSQAQRSQEQPQQSPIHHWGYQKHNTITDSAPVATQMLHAAGIAFACKLRKASVVTIAYSDDKASTEPDFQESLNFAAQHQLPIIFICEQDRIVQGGEATPSCTQHVTMPAQLGYQRLDGTDVVAVHLAMRAAMGHARNGYGPTLLEMDVTRSIPGLHMHHMEESNVATHSQLLSTRTFEHNDPLVRCLHYLHKQGAWDDEWASQLSTRIKAETERAMQEALREATQPG